MFFVKIQVRYKDGTEGLVDSPALEEMIVFGEISQFRRSHGWVNAACTETRGTSIRTYAGHERRRDVLSRETCFRLSKNQDYMRSVLSVSDLVYQYWCMIRRQRRYQ